MLFILNDVAFPYQTTFQDPATKWFDGIIDLHGYIMVYIFILLTAVIWILFSVISQNNVLPLKYNVEGKWLEFVWTIFPAFILISIALPSFKLLYWMDEVVDPLITLKVIGKQWYWDYEISDLVSYSSYMIPTEELEVGQYRLLEVDNRIKLPIHTSVRVLVTGGDVIHSWAIPSLGIKTDAIPGRLNQTSLFLEREGVFYGQCSELCGVGHSSMPIVVEGVSLDNYMVWLDSQ